MTTTGQTEVGRPFPPSECGLTPSDANPNLTCLGSCSNSGHVDSTCLWAGESTGNLITPGSDQCFLCQTINSAKYVHRYMCNKQGIMGNHLTNFLGTFPLSMWGSYRVSSHVLHSVKWALFPWNSMQSLTHAWTIWYSMPMEDRIFLACFQDPSKTFSSGNKRLWQYWKMSDNIVLFALCFAWMFNNPSMAAKRLNLAPWKIGVRACASTSCHCRCP